MTDTFRNRLARLEAKHQELITRPNRVDPAGRTGCSSATSTPS